MKKIFGILAVISAMLPLGSCQHKELCYDHPHTAELNVVIDWSKSGTPVQTTMEMILFPQEGGCSLHYQFSDNCGGRVKVPAGNYNALCFNTGSGANRYSGLDTRFNEFLITTRLSSESEFIPKSDVEEAILEPDVLYGAAIRDYFTVAGNEERTITFYPVQRTPHYTVIFTNVRNLKYTKGCSATLSSLACGYLLGSDIPNDSRHVQAFPVHRTEDTTMQGELTVFGHCRPGVTGHYVSVYFLLLDGQVVRYDYDVSEKLNDPALTGVMSATIVIDLDIELPKPIVNGSGFQPTVDGWEDEDIDIIM